MLFGASLKLPCTQCKVSAVQGIGTTELYAYDACGSGMPKQDPPGRRLPTLDLLKGFDAAARHLSFTRAGEELFLTQSALSRQMQTLEEQLGVPLFERAHRRPDCNAQDRCWTLC